jgi:hypothetical protein
MAIYSQVVEFRTKNQTKNEKQAKRAIYVSIKKYLPIYLLLLAFFQNPSAAH